MISHCLSYFKCIADFSLCVWLFSWFFNSRQLKNYSKFTIIASASFILHIVNTLRIPWLNTLATILCAFFIANTFFSPPFFSALISSIAVVFLSVMCEFFPLMILAVVVNKNVSLVLASPLNSAGFSLISTCCFFCILKCSKFIFEKKHKNTDLTVNNNGWAILFPAISIVLVYYTIYTDSFVSATRLRTVVHSILYCAIVIANIGFFLGETSITKRYKLREQLAELKFQQNKADAILKLKDEHIEEMNELIHDFNAQLSGLKELISNKDITQSVADHYIAEMRLNIQDLNNYIYVDSKPLQLILNQTNKVCIENFITFSVDIRYASFDFTTFPDIFSLFENALDNAVNACLSADGHISPQITLSIRRINDIVYIHLTNTNSVNPQATAIYSSHRATQAHGFGMNNIKRVVKKYNGTIQVEVSAEYSLFITFPLQ